MDTSAFVDRQSIEQVIESLRTAASAHRTRQTDDDLTNPNGDDEDQEYDTIDVTHYFKVVDSFDIPRWAYNVSQKAFVK